MTDRYGKFCPLLVVFLAAFSTMPLLQPYFFASSDGLFHLYRLMEYDTALRDGVWYPRWAPDFFYGLGMPIFNYYAPLAYYMAEVFHLLGAGYIDSFRLFAAVAMALSGLGAYLYLRTLLSPLASLLGAVVYMYGPYHLVNLYYRGDLAEYAAYVWFPFVLWAMTRLVQRRSFGYLFAGSVFYGALILTHNLSAFIFSGFLLVYGAAAVVREHWLELGAWRSILMSVFRLAAMAAAALALTAFFWVPALAEKSLVQFDRLRFFDFHRFFPMLEELLSTDLIHRYGVVLGIPDVFSYKLGVLQVGFLALGPVFLVWQRSRYKVGLRIEAVASLLVAAVSLFFIFSVSTWVWENVPLLPLTQFPWRFLAFIALPSALFAALVVEAAPGRLRWASALTLASVVIFSNVAGLFPTVSDIREADISPRGSMAFELGYGAIGTAAAAEYVPQWVKERPSISATALAAMLDEDIPGSVGRMAPGMEAVRVERRADRATYQVRAEKGGPFVPSILYFPGWEASINGHRVDIAAADPSGLIRVEVPAGDHTVSLRFVETPLRQASDLVSVAALLASLGALAAQWRRLREVRLPVPRVNRSNISMAALVVVLAPVWWLTKYAYDAAYLPPRVHGSPLVVNLDDEVLVESYELSGVLPSPGSAVRTLPDSTMRVTIFWRMLRDDPTRRYRPFVRLTNIFNQTWAYAEAAIEYPQSLPQPGETIAATIDLMVPSGTPPGVYLLEVGFEAMPAGRLLQVRRVQAVATVLPGERNVRLGQVIVGKRGSFDWLPAVPQPSRLLTEPVNFGDSLHLLDLSLADGEALVSGRLGRPIAPAAGSNAWEVQAGEVVHLDLLWQAARKLDEDLTITARLAGADGSLWAIRDSQPADGVYPTSFWTKGEVVRDQLNLAIPPETPPGLYELQLEVVAGSDPLSILDRNRVPLGPTLRIGKLSLLPSAAPADPESIAVQRRTNSPVLGELTIMGYTLGRRELQPGGVLQVDVFWQATKAITADLVMRLELVDSEGKPWASVTGRPAGDIYPTTAWRPGEVLRGQYSLVPGASTPEGEADLRIGLLDASSGRSLAQLSIDRVRILPRLRAFAADPSRPLEKDFGDKIRLLGYDVAVSTKGTEAEVPEVTPSGELKVTLYWRALAEMSTSYTVFTQVLDAAGRLVVQHDSLPQGGKAPTTSWLQDEVVADEHVIVISGDVSSGEYTLIAGLYDAAGHRLPSDGGDFVVLTPLRISPVAKR